jgi:cold shock CspA family protein
MKTRIAATSNHHADSVSQTVQARRSALATSSMLDQRQVVSRQANRQDMMNASVQTAQLQERKDALNGASNITLQRVEDEEPVQGKFEAIQRAEDEELVQGKFATLQKVEDEEPVQAKFEIAQRAEDEELVQGKFATVQKVEEEEPVQGKLVTVQRAEDEELVQERSLINTALQKKSSASLTNNSGLPTQLKAGIEALSGMNMDHVQVHYNSDRPAQLNAHAFAQGNEIHVASGQEQHLPHEAWHVVQQAQSRVKPTMQLKPGVPVNDDVGLENEADVMGAKAMQLGQSDKVSATPLQAKSDTAVLIQRKQTRPESVAADLLHAEYNNIFSAWRPSYNAIATGGGSYNSKLARLTTAVTNNREITYRRMAHYRMENGTEIPNLAGSGSELMYVHHNDEIKRANRNGEKLPHPALVGGDPDVTTAGTIHVNNLGERQKWGRTVTKYDIIVTNSSGHFQPDDVPDATVDKIKTHVYENQPSNTWYNVYKRER